MGESFWPYCYRSDQLDTMAIQGRLIRGVVLGKETKGRTTGFLSAGCVVLVVRLSERMNGAISAGAGAEATPRTRPHGEGDKCVSLMDAGIGETIYDGCGCATCWFF